MAGTQDLGGPVARAEHPGVEASGPVERSSGPAVRLGVEKAGVAVASRAEAAAVPITGGRAARARGVTAGPAASVARWAARAQVGVEAQELVVGAERTLVALAGTGGPEGRRAVD